MSGTLPAGSYSTLVRRPAVARTFGLALVGRLAYGMLPLSLLFTIQQSTDSFATAAVGTALNGLASLSMPLKARAIDRWGMRVVLPLVTLCAVTVLLVAALLASNRTTDAHVWWAVGLAVGLASPPLGPSMRAQWRRLVPEPELGQAYSLDAVAEETLYLLGPVLSAGLLSVAPPHAGLVIAAALLAVGSVGLAISPVATYTAPRGHRRSHRGPLRHPEFVRLLLVMGLAGAVTSTLFTTTAARALAVGNPAWAGLADAGVALGSVVGGLVWGRLRRADPWWRSLTWLVGFLGAVLLVASALPSFWWFALVLAVAGLVISPIYVVAYRSSDQLVDGAEVTEASTWVNTVTNLGISCGAAGAGALVTHVGASAPGWLGAGVALALACVLGLVGRRAQ